MATNTIFILSRTSVIDKTFQGLIADFMLTVARNLAIWCAKVAEQGNAIIVLERTVLNRSFLIL